VKCRITILNGEIAGQKFDLIKGQSFTIGRDTRADIPLPERKISRKHSKITWNEELNLITLEDLESLNGTYVNAHQINSKLELHDQDQIRIGSFLMKVEFNEKALQAQGVAKQEEMQMDSFIELANPMTDLSQQELEAFNLNSDLSNAQKAEDVYEELIESGSQQKIVDESEEPDTTGGRLILGKLSEISLPDLLQMLATTQKTGLLVVSNKKIGGPLRLDQPPQEQAYLYIEGGVILSASFQNLSPIEAFYESLSIEDGYFALYALPQIVFSDRIDLPVEALLLDGLRRLDEKRAKAEALKESDNLQALSDNSLTGLTSDELQIFQLAWKLKKVRSVLEKSPFSKNRTVEVLRKLVQAKYLKIDRA